MDLNKFFIYSAWLMFLAMSLIFFYGSYHFATNDFTTIHGVIDGSYKPISVTEKTIASIGSGLIGGFILISSVFLFLPEVNKK